jgi:hypothetical protein
MAPPAAQPPPAKLVPLSPSRSAAFGDQRARDGATVIALDEIPRTSVADPPPTASWAAVCCAERRGVAAARRNAATGKARWNGIAWLGSGFAKLMGKPEARRRRAPQHHGTSLFVGVLVGRM